MSAISTSTEDGNEDWRRLTDANERRRVQNRISQRNYRRNVKLRLQQLEVFGRVLTSLTASPEPKQALQLLSTHTTQADQRRRSSILSPNTDALPPPMESPISEVATLLNNSPIQLNSPCSIEDRAILSPGTDHKDNNSICHRDVDSVIDFEPVMPMIDLKSDFMCHMPNTETTSTRGLNALQKAVLSGNSVIARLLIDNGAEIYVLDELGNNIIHLAAGTGDAGMVAVVLETHSEVNKPNLLGNTPLHIAVESGHEEVVQLLLKAGADMELRSVISGQL